MLPIKTTEFVEQSDLFKGCQKAWRFFENSEPNCDFGNNNRTLVNSSIIVSVLNLCDDEEGELAKQIKIVLERIEEARKILVTGDSDDFYVDLEN
jgi:hypothetical protein